MLWVEFVVLLLLFGEINWLKIPGDVRATAGRLGDHASAGCWPYLSPKKKTPKKFQRNSKRRH
jgi:hypothetical protein